MFCNKNYFSIFEYLIIISGYNVYTDITPTKNVYKLLANLIVRITIINNNL